jgi:hypothetical protein
MVRAYLPLSTGELDEALRRGRLEPGDRSAHAVTPEVVAQLPDAADEEREYAALTAAALDALRLVGGGPALRVVAAVDAPQAEPRPDDDASPTAVRLPGELPLRLLASVHVDAPEASADVRAASRALAEGAGEDDPRVARGLDHDLAWYAVQELEDLVASWR